MTERLEWGWGHSRKTSPKRRRDPRRCWLCWVGGWWRGKLGGAFPQGTPPSLFTWQRGLHLSSCCQEEGHGRCSSQVHLSIYPCPVPLSLQSWKHLSLLCFATTNKEAPNHPKRGPESVCPVYPQAVGHLERNKSRTEGTPLTPAPGVGIPGFPLLFNWFFRQEWTGGGLQAASPACRKLTLRRNPGGWWGETVPPSL